MKPALPACLTTALALAALPAPAQEEIGERLLIELNAVESHEDGCKLSFLVLNGYPADIDRAVFETVLFDAGGQVDRLTLFDFGALPANRPRVRQFVVPGVDCAGLGRVLFNGAQTCEGAGLDPRACETGLRLESRTDIEVTG